MFEITIHGCRGSYPVSDQSFTKYGGSTSCVEVRCGDEIIIIDAGTGIVGCGAKLLAEKKHNIRLLFSHVHWDHIQGFPFFACIFNPQCNIDIYSGNLTGKYEGGIEKALAYQMQQPFFPVQIKDVARAKIRYSDFGAGEKINFSNVKVFTAPLNHPQGAVGYRIEYAGKVFAYVSDTEHLIGKLDKNVLKLMDGADYVIYDSAYDDEEFDQRIGWGHSTWQQAIRLAKECGVGRIGIFHHDPTKNDADLDARNLRIQRVWPGAAHTRVGEKIKLIEEVNNLGVRQIKL